MPDFPRVRRLLAAAVVLAAAAPVAALAPAQASAPVTTAHHKPHHASRTQFAFLVSECEGCRIQLYQAVSNTSKVWHSGVQRVTDGKVRFIIPTRRTLELNATVRAPWDGDLGYVTNVVFGYPGQRLGSIVSINQATDHQRGGGCWTGTTKRAVTMALSVTEVSVVGRTGKKTHGTLAWTTRTQDWRRPIFKASDGVLGAQDDLVCQPT